MTNTVLIKRSGTANSVPLAGNLSLGELALNYTDGNLFYKNSSNVVTVIASNKFLSVTGNVTAGNLSGTSIVGTLTTAAQTNITSVGTLTSLAVTGNTTGGNILTGGLISATSTVTGSQFNGSGAGLTSIPGANVTGTVPLATSATTAGTVTTAAQGNITSVGTLTSLNVTGNITGGNLSVTSIVGTLTTAAQNNITSIGTLGSLSVTGNITGGNVLGGANVNATTHTGTTVSVSANITGGNLLTGGLISATANITGGNLSGTSIVGTLTTAAQTNITSVGTLGSLTVTGNITGGNVLGGANVNATTHTGTTVSVTGNITGGNVLGGANVNATTHTGTTVSVTGQITGGNISATGISSATTDFRLGGLSYSRVAIPDGGGGFVGGYNTTYSSGVVYDSSSAPISAIYYGSDGNLKFYSGPSATAGTAAPERLRIDTGGNVGIGTSSPTGKLDISATTDGQLMAQVRNLSSGSSAYSAFFLGNDTNATAAYVGLNSSTNTARGGGANSFNIITGLNGPLTLGVAGAEKVRIDSSGSLLVGTTTSTIGKIVAAYTSVGTSPLAPAYAGLNLWGDSSVRLLFGTYTASPYAAYIQASNTGTGFPIALNPSGGNVGIGTSSPNGRLSVIPAANPTTAATSTTLTLGETTNNSAYQLRMAYSYLSSVYTGVIDAVQNSAGAPLTINPTGGIVGVGTTAPNTSATTTIKQGSSAYQLQLEQSNATDGYGLRCDAANGDLTFNRYASGAYTERVKFTLDGNIQLSTAGTKILNSSGKPILQQTGSVLQVVSTTLNTYGSTGSQNYVLVGGLSVAITPASTTNKVLIRGYIWLSGSTQNGMYGAVFRDGSILTGVAGSAAQPSAIVNGTVGTVTASGGFIPASGYVTYQATPICFEFLDSPASTSSLTYQIGVRVGGGGVVYYNYQSNTGGNPDFGYFASTITAMEIVA
jgi:hypothetical protein